MLDRKLSNETVTKLRDQVLPASFYLQQQRSNQNNGNSSFATSTQAVVSKTDQKRAKQDKTFNMYKERSESTKDHISPGISVDNNSTHKNAVKQLRSQLNRDLGPYSSHYDPAKTTQKSTSGEHLRPHT